MAYPASVLTASGSLRAVDVAELEEYPLGAEDRLESHFFIAWEHRRWLNSEMRLKGAEEARALYFDLICLSQDQSPVGTLPDDSEQLAKLLGVEEARFRRLCDTPYGPLHHWEPCLCDGVIRLMHPVVLRMVLDARARKQDNRARMEAANRQKRVQRLRQVVGGIHADLAKNDAAVLWIDEWLEGQGCTYRSISWVQNAIGAWSDHTVGRVHTGRRGPS